MEFILALLHPKGALKSTPAALHSALKAAMLRAAQGARTEDQCPGARRRSRDDEGCEARNVTAHVREGAVHVSNVSPAKAIGWTSAETPRIRLNLSHPLQENTKCAEFRII